MTTPKQSAIVSRDYKHAPDPCADALELLLKRLPASKEGGSAAAPTTKSLHAMKGGQHDLATTYEQESR